MVRKYFCDKVTSRSRGMTLLKLSVTLDAGKPWLVTVCHVSSQ